MRLLGAAYSLVYGLVGRINLAFGELAAASGYAAYLGVAIAGPAAGVTTLLLAALALALTAGLSYGIATGRFVFAPMMQQTGQRVLIATIALAIVLQEFLRLAQGARLKWVQPVLQCTLCRRTGRRLRGHGDARGGGRGRALPADRRSGAQPHAQEPVRPHLARLRRRSGRGGAVRRRPPVVLLKTFALASVTAGLAGYVVTVYYGTLGYAGGIVLGLKALLAAVAGGIGSVPGAFLGGMLLGRAEAPWSALFPIELRDLVVFSLLVVMLVLRPNGLFGLRELLPPEGVTVGIQHTSSQACEPRQLLLDDVRIEAGAQRQGGVVEVVAGVVHLAAALAVAVADVDVGAGHALQHEGEILRGHDQRPRLRSTLSAPTSVGCGIGDELGLLRRR